ncbi:hypothetical protein NLM24_00670, partial [Nocardia zapadnayensis]|nr:hypothetical protein [Nocardia zapadnayensis]
PATQRTRLDDLTRSRREITELHIGRARRPLGTRHPARHHEPDAQSAASFRFVLVALIVGEIGGFAVLLAGFAAGELF